MKIYISKKEQGILKKLLSEEIEKSIGISPPQETFLQNIDSGWTLEKAECQFTTDNNQYLTYMQSVKKDPLFILLNKINIRPGFSIKNKLR